MTPAPDTRFAPAGAAEAAATRLVGILGTSFSGSTVLNLILGAHPEIYGGGELIGLVQQRGRAAGGACSSCGLDCRYWTPAAREMATKANLYRLAERIFGKRILVDSSKSLDWFGEVLGGTENAGIAPLYVLTIKHPIRYLASCVVNIAKPRPRRFSLASLRDPRAARMSFVDRLVADLDQYYRTALAALSAGGAEFHRLQYESLVDNPRLALAPLLRSLGLSYDDRMDRFYDMIHHQIGGNNGALYQVTRSWQGAEHETPAFRRAFYETHRGLRIDDKYEEAFTAEELARLKADATIRALAERLGYGDPGLPFPIR
jgi:hypothetical protein